MPASIVDIDEIMSRPVSAILDPCNQDEFIRVFPAKDANKHIHLLASSGSGKTELLKILFIKKAEENNSSIIIFDQNGDFSKECAMMFKDKKRFIYINLGLYRKRTPCINPFRVKLDEETIAVIAQELVNAFEGILKTEFSDNMEAILLPCIYVLLNKGNSGLDELIKFMNNDKELITLGYESPIPSHKNFFQTQFMKDKFNVTKNALATKLQVFLNNPIFANFITGDSTINLEKELNTKGKIIIVNFPKDKMRRTLEPAAKLTMALIQGIILKRANEPKESRVQTYLFLDEVQNFTGPTLNEMLAESRKNNLSVIGAHQNLTQLDLKLRDVLFSNALIKIVGYNSNKDFRVMADEIDVDIARLKQLKRGDFFVKIASAPAILIHTTDKYIDNKFTISLEAWIENMKHQKKNYYRKIDNFTSIQKILTNNDTLPAFTADD